MRAVAEARAATAAARADLDGAIARGDRDYRVLATRLKDFDRRLRAVRERLAPATVDRGGPERGDRRERRVR